MKILFSLLLGVFITWLFLKSGFLMSPITVAQLPDGGRYVGQLDNGVLQGQGEVSWPTGASYVGEFKNGLFHGEGLFTNVFGDTYCCQFMEGTLSGVGEIKNSDGGIYKGEVKRWQKHGQGTFSKAEKIFKGEFVEDKLTGQGEYFEADQLIYSGDFIDWVYAGEGELNTKNGIYKGEFKDGLYHGKGQYKSNILKKTFTGEFSEGYIARGIYTDDTGVRYEGEFSFWRYEGQGILNMPNGDYYVGGFNNGRYNGKGSMTLSNAVEGISEYTGIWDNGRLIQSDHPQMIEDYPAAMESALYNESTLLGEKLALLGAGDPTKEELYFFGVAGDGTQKVFHREVAAFKRFFSEKYQLSNRAVTLVNDRDKIGKLPMATMTSIRKTLQALSEKMNLDQDVLLLYLTSHGSEDHELALDNNSVSLPDMPVATLAGLLKESAIKWKLIIVSACYSGGFIEPLKDDNTLIITAAAADKTSFGCSDEAEMTYFGQALLDSLPSSADMEEVFKATVEEVKRREESVGVKHSAPQIFIGKYIKAKLSGLL